METSQIRDYIYSTIMKKCVENESARKNAIGEFIALTMPNIDEGGVKNLKEMIPAITKLYDKWIQMFTDRLLETVPRNQIEELCSGTKENEASLILVYIMFMESERMEKQVDEDIKKYGSTQTDESGNLAAEYIRAKLTLLSEQQKDSTIH